MGFYHCDEATQFNTISHLQKIPLFDIAHFGTIYRHVSIRHDCKNKIVCEKAEYLLLLPPLRSILLSAKFLFKFCLSSFVRKQYTSNYRFYQDQPLKCISQSEHELFNGACKNSSHHFLCPSKWCIWSPLNLLKVTCTLSWFNVMFDITAQLNIDGIGLSWCRYKRSFSFSQWLLSDCCPQRGSCNTLRVEETGKDFSRKLYCVYQLFWQWLMLFVRF